LAGYRRRLYGKTGRFLPDVDLTGRVYFSRENPSAAIRRAGTDS